MQNGSPRIEKAAKAVVEAMVLGDRATRESFGCSQRSLNRWRQFIRENPLSELATRVREKKRIVEDKWGEELSEAVLEATRFLKRAAKEASTSDPSMVHSIAGALKMLSEVSIAQRMLDARISGEVRKARKKHR